MTTFLLRFCIPITIANHRTLKNQNPGKREESPQAFAGAEKRIDFLSEIIYNVNDVLIIRKNIGMRDMRNLKQHMPVQTPMGFIGAEAERNPIAV